MRGALLVCAGMRAGVCAAVSWSAGGMRGVCAAAGRSPACMRGRPSVYAVYQRVWPDTDSDSAHTCAHTWGKPAAHTSRAYSAHISPRILLISSRYSALLASAGYGVINHPQFLLVKG